jgi:hypothetical protein
VTNAGKISGIRRGVCVDFVGSVINETSGTISASTPAAGAGSIGVNLPFGGVTVTNEAGATISAYGQRYATGVSGGTGTVQNYGNIVSNGQGVFLQGYGCVVNNGKGGTISGANDFNYPFGEFIGGVRIGGGSGTVTNAGAISGKVGVYIDGYFCTGSAERVTNAGTISGTIASVEFAGSGANILTLETGSTLNGDAIGSTASGATNALVLQGHGTANNNFDNFNTLDVQANAAWALGGDSTFGATTVSGALLVEGDVSGGATTLGGPGWDFAQLAIAPTGAWDIRDDSGIALGGSAPSFIWNSGLFEKTGGSGTSAITPLMVNTGNVLASSGTLDLQEAVIGIGADTISGASTLEFGSTVWGGQTAGFTGGGGTLDLIDPLGFAGKIAGFAATDSVDLAGDWVFSHFSENSKGTLGTLTLTSGANHLSLNFLGDYTKNDFTIASGAATTTIGHA